MNNGWVKSVDPNSGRVFFANHITRKTQWTPPEGWVEETPPQAVSEDEDEDEELPSNWETLHDPTTGKPFYIDHERKITQWTRPKVEKKTAAISYAPASISAPGATTSVAMARILRATGGVSSSNNNHNNTSSGTTTTSLERSYSEEAAYYQHSHSGASTDVDFSDSMPTLDFSVKKSG